MSQFPDAVDTHTLKVGELAAFRCPLDRHYTAGKVLEVIGDRGDAKVLFFQGGLKTMTVYCANSSFFCFLKTDHNSAQSLKELKGLIAVMNL